MLQETKYLEQHQRTNLQCLSGCVHARIAHVCVCSCMKVYKAVLQCLQCLWICLACCVFGSKGMHLYMAFQTQSSPLLSLRSLVQFGQHARMYAQAMCICSVRLHFWWWKSLKPEMLYISVCVCACQLKQSHMHWCCTVLTRLKNPGCFSSFSASRQLLS